jgi:hypothetical protein
MNLPNRNTLHCALRIFRPFPVTMCSEKLTNFKLFVQMFEFVFPHPRQISDFPGALLGIFSSSMI